MEGGDHTARSTHSVCLYFLTTNERSEPRAFLPPMSAYADEECDRLLAALSDDSDDDAAESRAAEDLFAQLDAEQESCRPAASASASQPPPTRATDPAADKRTKYGQGELVYEDATCTEDFSGLRLSRRSVGAKDLRDQLEGIRVLKLPDVALQALAPGPWATIGILARVSTREAADGRPESDTWLLSNLHPNAPSTLTVHIQGAARSDPAAGFLSASQAEVGGVYAVVGPKLVPARSPNAPPMCVTSRRGTLVLIGRAAELGRCRCEQGGRCGRLIHRKAIDYCPEHARLFSAPPTSHRLEFAGTTAPLPPAKRRKEDGPPPRHANAAPMPSNPRRAPMPKASAAAAAAAAAVVALRQRGALDRRRQRWRAGALSARAHARGARVSFLRRALRELRSPLARRRHTTTPPRTAQPSRCPHPAPPVPPPQRTHHLGRPWWGPAPHHVPHRPPPT